MMMRDQDVSLFLLTKDATWARNLRNGLPREHVTVHRLDSLDALLQSFEWKDQSGPACIVLDVTDVEVDANLTYRLRNLTLPVIVVAASPTVRQAVEFMKLGAVDYLEKSAEPHNVVGPTEQVISDERHRYIEQAEFREMAARVSSLTQRERELLSCIIAGRSTKEIAVDLSIAFSTVSNHRASLMVKTGAKNAADLVRIGLLAGFGPNHVQPPRRYTSS